MGAYDRFMQVVTEDGVETLVPGTQEPFRLLVDEEARRAVIERVGRVGPTRGHRNVIKAEMDELDGEAEQSAGVSLQ
jgi:ketosteroid isomerase-like protein